MPESHDNNDKGVLELNKREVIDEYKVLSKSLFSSCSYKLITSQGDSIIISNAKKQQIRTASQTEGAKNRPAGSDQNSISQDKNRE